MVAVCNIEVLALGFTTLLCFDYISELSSSLLWSVETNKDSFTLITTDHTYLTFPCLYNL